MTFVVKLKHFINTFNRGKCYHSLIGKNFIKPFDLEPEELKSLLWTAIELKELDKTKKLRVDLLQDKLVFLLSNHEDFEYVPLAAACKLLKTNLYKVVKAEWDHGNDLLAERKYLESNVDIMFCQSKRCDNVIKMTEGSKIPIVSIASNRYAINSVLADMMTLQQHFGRLKGLYLSWFGPTGRFINTYMEIATSLGINVSYCCCCIADSPQTPLVAQQVKENLAGAAKLEEITDGQIITNKTHVIVLQLGEDVIFDLSAVIENTYLGWVFLQKPYSLGSVEEILMIRSKDSETSSNNKYIVAAIMVRFLFDYQHSTAMPKF